MPSLCIRVIVVVVVVVMVIVIIIIVLRYTGPRLCCCLAPAVWNSLQKEVQVSTSPQLFQHRIKSWAFLALLWPKTLHVTLFSNY